MPENVSIDRIVAAYFKIKAQRAAFNRYAEEIDGEFRAKLEALENHCLGYLNETKQDSFQASGGTVYRHLNIIPSASDWSLVYDWIKATDAWGMLERRLTSSFVRQYMEANKGAIPPGVSVLKRFEAKIRHLPRKKGQLPDD